MPKPINLQDTFLNHVRREQTPVTIHVTNGYQINNAVIQGYDSFVILAEAEGKQLMIYKHAVSTISPQRRVELNGKETGKEPQAHV